MPTTTLKRKPVYPYGAEDSFAESEDDAPVQEPSSSSSTAQYISDTLHQWLSYKQQDQAEKVDANEAGSNVDHFDPYDSFLSDNDELATVPTAQLSQPGPTNDDRKPSIENEPDVEQVDAYKSSPEPEPVTNDDEQQDATDEDHNNNVSYETCSSEGSNSSYASEDFNDQSPGDEDDGYDSDYYPDSESDGESDEDNDELRKGIDANELLYLQSDKSLSPESLRQLYEQRQAYSEKLTVKQMIMVIINACISYFPSNTRDYSLSFKSLFAILALSVTFLITLLRYNNGYCDIQKIQKGNYISLCLFITY